MSSSLLGTPLDFNAERPGAAAAHNAGQESSEIDLRATSTRKPATPGRGGDATKALATTSSASGDDEPAGRRKKKRTHRAAARAWRADRRPENDAGGDETPVKTAQVLLITLRAPSTRADLVAALEARTADVVKSGKLRLVELTSDTKARIVVHCQFNDVAQADWAGTPLEDATFNDGGSRHDGPTFKLIASGRTLDPAADMRHCDERFTVFPMGRSSVRLETTDRRLYETVLAAGEVMLDDAIPREARIYVEASRPRQCAKCHSLRHVTALCSSGVLACGFCSANHETNSCVEKAKRHAERAYRCTNCKGAHPAFSWKCPLYKEAGRARAATRQQDEAPKGHVVAGDGAPAKALRRPGLSFAAASGGGSAPAAAGMDLEARLTRLEEKEAMHNTKLDSIMDILSVVLARVGGAGGGRTNAVQL